MNIVVLVRTCSYQIFNSLKLFISQPIVIKLCTQIDDNILTIVLCQIFKLSPN